MIIEDQCINPFTGQSISSRHGSRLTFKKSNEAFCGSKPNESVVIDRYRSNVPVPWAKLGNHRHRRIAQIPKSISGQPYISALIGGNGQCILTCSRSMSLHNLAIANTYNVTTSCVKCPNAIVRSVDDASQKARHARHFHSGKLSPLKEK